MTAAGGGMFPPLPDFPPIPYPNFLPMEKYPTEILEGTKKRTEEIIEHGLEKLAREF